MLDSPSSESEFVDIESFSDKEADPRKSLNKIVAIADAAKPSEDKRIVILPEQVSTENTSSEFMAELDDTVNRNGASCQGPKLVQFHGDLPEGTSDPNTKAYNQTCGTDLKGKLLCIGGPGIGRDDDPLGFDVLWHSKDLIIKTALETGGDVLHKKVSISDDLDILKESQLETATSKIPEMLASSEPGDNQVGNYFDPKGELFFGTFAIFY